MSNAFTEGGQTWSHNIRMMRQVTRTANLYGFSAFLLTFFILMLTVDLNIYLGSFYNLKAKLFQTIFLDTSSVNKSFWAQVARVQYSQDPLIKSSLLELYTQGFLSLLYAHIKKNASRSLIFGLLTVAYTWAFFGVRGTLKRRVRHLSGKSLIHPKFLALQIQLKRKASPIKIGSIPLIKGTENQHIMISGGTGSGKTNCINSILNQIAAQKGKVLILDTSGLFAKRYYDPKKDILLNPFDENSSSWNPLLECKNSYDLDALAESFIPQSMSESTNYWRSAASTPTHLN